MRNKLLNSNILLHVLAIMVIFSGCLCSAVNTKNSTDSSTKNVLLLSLLLNENEKEISVGGLTRKYLDFVPNNLPEDPPVLLVFHGSGGSATKFRNQIGSTLEKMAVNSGAILIYLTGFEGHFNDCRKMADYSARKKNINDTLFARRVVDKLREETGKKLSSVYAIGYSNGGHMAYRLAIEEDFLKGIIAVSANVPAPENMDCSLHKSERVNQPNIAIIQGTRDPINPTSGGDVVAAGISSRGRVVSTEESARWFAELYKLPPTNSPDKIQTKNKSLVKSQIWEDERSGVLMFLLEGYGHTVPQEFSPFPLALGPTLHDNSVLENAWRFIRTKENTKSQ